MSWEGFGIFLGIFIGGPLLLATFLIGGTVAAVCSVPVGVAWALAAMVRPEIVTRRKRRSLQKEASPPTEGTD